SALTMRMPFVFRSARFIFNAAGFIAISTSTLSPGVYTLLEEKWTWKPLTPGSVPAGARISAGKSGKVAKSFPYSATVLVNWLPVICMPSPESPAKRMTARSITSRLCFTGGVSIKVDIVARAPLFPNSHTNFPEGVWLNLLDGQYENQVGFSIQPPGADRRR